MKQHNFFFIYYNHEKGSLYYEEKHSYLPSLFDLFLSFIFVGTGVFMVITTFALLGYFWT